MDIKFAILAKYQKLFFQFNPSETRGGINEKMVPQEERRIMKTIKYEVKLETSVKIILGVLALGIFLNAFATSIAQELFGIKAALA